MVGNPLRIYADDDTIKDAPNVVEWCNLLNEAGDKTGKSADSAHLYKQWMQDAGFHNVKEEMYKVYSLPNLVVETNPCYARSR